MNYDTDFDDTRRGQVLQHRTSVASHATNTAYTTTDLEQLRFLVLDLASIILDDPQYTADDRETSRSLDSNGVPIAPEYRHEFLMNKDDPYYYAWAYDHSPTFADSISTDQSAMTLVTAGHQKHSYFEEDPAIVSRSLLRHGLREREEGEQDPPPVVGVYAPANTINLTGDYAINRTFEATIEEA